MYAIAFITTHQTSTDTGLLLPPERRRQVDNGPRPDDTPAADCGNRTRGWLRRGQGGAEGADADRGRSAGGCPRPVAHGPRPPPPASDPPERSEVEARRAR